MTVKAPKYFLIIASLLVGFALSSCEKDLDGEPIVKGDPSTSDTPTFGSSGSTVNCEDCPKRIDNGSFETVNGPISNLTIFNQGLVPSWIPVSASPSIVDQSGLPGVNYTLPSGYDGSHVSMLGVTANNASPDGYWNEAIANTNIQIYGDYDLEYCLRFRHFSLANSTFFNIQPSKVIAYISSDIPASSGSDYLSDFDITDHSYKEVGATQVSSGAWDLFETTFTSTKDYNQLTFVPYFLAQHYPSSAKALVHIDDVQVRCQTNALKDIDALFVGDNQLQLSPVFSGLPDDVTIASYSWTVTHYPSGNIYYSSDEDPTFTIPYSSTDGFQVCLQITDSRDCCGKFCKLITPPKISCPKNTFTVNADDAVFSNDNDGVSDQKKILALQLSMCSAPSIELWGHEEIGNTCEEDYLYGGSHAVVCGPSINLDCNINDLLALGQANLSAVCPGAVLTASNNFKTWTLSLPNGNSCGIEGLRMLASNREYNINCKPIWGSNDVESVLDLDDQDCQCSQ